MKRLLGLINVLIAVNAAAADTDRLDELCYGLSVGTVAEMRARYYPQMTEHEMDIVRKTAIVTCINLNSEDNNEAVSLPVAGTGKAGEPEARRSAEAKSSGWMDRILGTENQEKKTTIKRRQQAGGK